MSGIQGLSSDQQQVYNQLINDAGTVNVSRATVDKELQVAMDAGLSFQEAAAQVRNDLPTLTPPKSSSGSLGGWVGVASPMASINALITEMSAEQRKENREVMKAQTDSIAMSMEQQADEIRKKAVAQLVCGVVSGAINIGMGAVQFGMGMKQLNMGKQQGALAKEQGVLGKQQTDIANKQADLKSLRSEGAKLSGDELKQFNAEYSSRKASLKAGKRPLPARTASSAFALKAIWTWSFFRLMGGRASCGLILARFPLRNRMRMISCGSALPVWSRPRAPGGRSFRWMRAGFRCTLLCLWPRALPPCRGMPRIF